MRGVSAEYKAYVCYREVLDSTAVAGDRTRVGAGSDYQVFAPPPVIHIYSVQCNLIKFLVLLLLLLLMLIFLLFSICLTVTRLCIS